MTYYVVAQIVGLYYKEFGYMLESLIYVIKQSAGDYSCLTMLILGKPNISKSSSETVSQRNKSKRAFGSYMSLKDISLKDISFNNFPTHGDLKIFLLMVI